MITKNEFLECIKVLEVSYSNFKLDKEAMRIWYSLLNDYSKDQLQYAIIETTKKSKYVPTIATIREQISKLETSDDYLADKFASSLINNMFWGYDVYFKKYSRKNKTKYTRVVENGILRYEEQLTKIPNELYDPIATAIIERNKERLIHHQTEDNMSLHAQLKKMYLSELQNTNKNKVLENNPQLGINIKSLASNLRIRE